MFILYVLRFASLFQFNRRKFYRLTWQLETADDIFMLMLLRQCTAYQRPYLILSFDQNETRSEQLSALPYKEDGWTNSKLQPVKLTEKKLGDAIAISKSETINHSLTHWLTHWQGELLGDAIASNNYQIVSMVEHRAGTIALMECRQTIDSMDKKPSPWKFTGVESIHTIIMFNVYVTLSKYNIPLKCLLPSWHWHCNSFSAQDLKYELWHFVGGARLAQNLRLRNHCHFHKDLLW